MISNQTKQRLKRAIGERVFPGCVLGVTDANGNRELFAEGTMNYESREPVKADTIFDVASVTKTFPTAVLALMLLDRGRLELDDQATMFVPELHHPMASDITVRHLLTHTLDYGLSLSSLKDLDPPEILKAILIHSLRRRPGDTFLYCNATSIILGLLVERLYGKPLDVTSHRQLLHPLRMQRTTFYPRRFPVEEIAPTEIDPWRGRLIRGEIHDESAWKLRKIMIPGSAGLFSTAPDLMNFLQMILAGGAFEDQRFLSRKTINRMFTNQIKHLDADTGLGWELNQPRYMGSEARQIAGKTGFTGCVIMCHAKRSLGLVLLSNTTYPRRHSDRERINEVRREVADLVFGGSG